MKIKTISYGRTYSNGNYEFSRIDYTADVEEGDGELECMEDLYEWVHVSRQKEIKLMKENEKKEK